MADPYAQMLGNPNLSEEQRAKILKMQARRRQREMDQQADALAGSTIAVSRRPTVQPTGVCRVRLSFLQPCWLTPWNLVTKMLSKQLHEPLELSVRRDATVGDLQGMIETATGMRCARQRLYVARLAADCTERDHSSATEAILGMQLLRTDKPTAQIAALCTFWPGASATQRETDKEQRQEPFAVWLAAVPGSPQLSTASEEVGKEQAQQQIELEEQLRCQLIASGGLQLSYDTDVFTRPMHHTGASVPQPEPEGQVEPQ